MCFKISSQFLVKPLTYICNLSLSQVNFPEQLKIANVIPLYKSEDSVLFYVVQQLQACIYVMCFVKDLWKDYVQ